MRRPRSGQVDLFVNIEDNIPEFVGRARRAGEDAQRAFTTQAVLDTTNFENEITRMRQLARDLQREINTRKSGSMAARNMGFDEVDGVSLDAYDKKTAALQSKLNGLNNAVESNRKLVEGLGRTWARTFDTMHAHSTTTSLAIEKQMHSLMQTVRTDLSNLGSKNSLNQLISANDLTAVRNRIQELERLGSQARTIINSFHANPTGPVRGAGGKFVPRPTMDQITGLTNAVSNSGEITQLLNSLRRIEDAATRNNVRYTNTQNAQNAIGNIYRNLNNIPNASLQEILDARRTVSTMRSFLPAGDPNTKAQLYDINQALLTRMRELRGSGAKAQHPFRADADRVLTDLVNQIPSISGMDSTGLESVRRTISQHRGYATSNPDNRGNIYDVMSAVRSRQQALDQAERAARNAPKTINSNTAMNVIGQMHGAIPNIANYSLDEVVAARRNLSAYRGFLPADPTQRGMVFDVNKALLDRMRELRGTGTSGQYRPDADRGVAGIHANLSGIASMDNNALNTLRRELSQHRSYVSNDPTTKGMMFDINEAIVNRRQAIAQEERDRANAGREANKQIADDYIRRMHGAISSIGRMNADELHGVRRDLSMHRGFATIDPNTRAQLFDLDHAVRLRQRELGGAGGGGRGGNNRGGLWGSLMDYNGRWATSWTDRIAGMSGVPLYGMGLAGLGMAGVGSSIKLASEYDNMRNVLAGVINTYGKFRGNDGKFVDSSRNFELSYGYSEKVFDMIRKRAIESPLSTTEEFSYALAGLPTVLSRAKGIKMDDAIRVIDQMASLGKAQGLAPRDVEQDIRATVSGDIRGTNKIGKMLGFTAKGVEDAYATGGGQGFVAYFDSKFKGLEPGLKRFASGFEANWSNFLDSMMQVGRKFGTAVIPMIIKPLQELGDSITKWAASGNAERLASSVGGMLQSLAKAVQSFVDTVGPLVNNGVTLAFATFGTLMAGFVVKMQAQALLMQNPVLGIIAGVGVLIAGLIAKKNQLDSLANKNLDKLAEGPDMASRENARQLVGSDIAKAVKAGDYAYVPEYIQKYRDVKSDLNLVGGVYDAKKRLTTPDPKITNDRAKEDAIIRGAGFKDRDDFARALSELQSWNLRYSGQNTDEARYAYTTRMGMAQSIIGKLGSYQNFNKNVIAPSATINTEVKSDTAAAKARLMEKASDSQWYSDVKMGQAGDSYYNEILKEAVRKRDALSNKYYKAGYGTLSDTQKRRVNKEVESFVQTYTNPVEFFGTGVQPKEEKVKKGPKQTLVESVYVAHAGRVLSAIENELSRVAPDAQLGGKYVAPMLLRSKAQSEIGLAYDKYQKDVADAMYSGKGEQAFRVASENYAKAVEDIRARYDEQSNAMRENILVLKEQTRASRDQLQIVKAQNDLTGKRYELGRIDLTTEEGRRKYAKLEGEITQSSLNLARMQGKSERSNVEFQNKAELRRGDSTSTIQNYLGISDVYAPSAGGSWAAPSTEDGSGTVLQGGGKINFRHPKDISSMNPAVLSRLNAAANALGMELRVGTAITGHSKYVKGKKTVSRHVSGNAVDIDMINGVSYRSNPKAFKAYGDRLADYLDSIGASRNVEAGNDLAYMWQTMKGGNHYNHIHFSSTESGKGLDNSLFTKYGTSKTRPSVKDIHNKVKNIIPAAMSLVLPGLGGVFGNTAVRISPEVLEKNKVDAKVVDERTRGNIQDVLRQSQDMKDALAQAYLGEYYKRFRTFDSETGRMAERRGIGSRDASILAMQQDASILREQAQLRVQDAESRLTSVSNHNSGGFSGMLEIVDAQRKFEEAKMGQREAELVASDLDRKAKHLSDTFSLIDQKASMVADQFGRLGEIKFDQQIKAAFDPYSITTREGRFKDNIGLQQTFLRNSIANQVMNEKLEMQRTDPARYTELLQAGYFQNRETTLYAQGLAKIGGRLNPTMVERMRFLDTVDTGKMAAMASILTNPIGAYREPLNVLQAGISPLAELQNQKNLAAMFRGKLSYEEWAQQNPEIAAKGGMGAVLSYGFAAKSFNLRTAAARRMAMSNMGGQIAGNLGGMVIGNAFFGNKDQGSVQMGSSLGTTIGAAVGGPWGAAAGGVLGGVLGGLIGGKKKDPEEERRRQLQESHQKKVEDLLSSINKNTRVGADAYENILSQGFYGTSSLWLSGRGYSRIGILSSVGGR